ncbi:MAG: hypothetical protein CMJ29_08835 [Phycisphaerae bacterium]|nr:hypothetical protein [Phycisphaerae bacterium]
MTRFAAVTILLFLGSVAFGQASSVTASKKPSAEALIENWTQMSSWSSDQIKAVTTTWKGWDSDGHADVSYDFGNPDSFQVETSNPDGTERTSIGSNGSISWICSTRGKGDKAEVEDADLLSKQQSLFFELAFNPASMKTLQEKCRKIVNAGRKDFEGTPCWRVLCLPHDSRRSVELYFAISSGYWKGLNATIDKDGKMEAVFRVLIDEFGFAGNSTLAAMSGPGLPVHMKLYTGGKLFQDLRAEQITLGDTMAPVAIPAPILALTNRSSSRSARTSKPAKSNSEAAAGDHHKRLISMIGPTLMTASGEAVPSSVLAADSNVLLYFSAKWCPPCRKFTPSLVDFYDQHSQDGDFTVIFVSSDRSVSEMQQYMKDYKMNFYAVPFDRVTPSGLKQTYGDRGIPNLVWINADDQAVAKSYVNGSYVGPARVLQQFGETLSRN